MRGKHRDEAIPERPTTNLPSFRVPLARADFFLQAIGVLVDIDHEALVGDVADLLDIVEDLHVESEPAAV